MLALVEGSGGGPDALAAIAREHLATGGKRLRARLAVAAALKLGARPGDAVVWATACELAHNATLIHDDLQDGDHLRRGQPTCWVRHGAPQAINAGDLLLMLAVSAVAEADLLAACRAELAAVLARGMVTVIRGQGLECDLARRTQADAPTYQAIVRQKTAALFELPVQGAAIMAGLSAPAAAQAAAPFAALGVLFQLQDDVLDLYGDKGREAPGADLREGKVSALVVAHCRRHPGEQAELLALLREPRATTSLEAVAHFSARFRHGGALADVLAQIDDCSEAAQAQVPAVLAPLMAALVARICAPIAIVL